MLIEVNELSEMLCRVKSGKFKSDTADELDELFEEPEYYPEWDDEFFKIDNGSQKPLRKEYMNQFTIEVKKPKSASRKGRKKSGRKLAPTLGE